jgi:hypothetical protein
MAWSIREVKKWIKSLDEARFGEDNEQCLRLNGDDFF